jgi:DNA-binding FadR family transcriptional regulator
MSTQATPVLTPPLRRRSRSLSQEVVDEITSRISKGVLKPGEKLPTEAAIMREMDVSRTVVREAISRLQAAGLVETRHGIGTFVLEPQSESGFVIDPATINTIYDVLALLELRISLETEAAGLAAIRRTDEQLQQMRVALDAFYQALESGGNTLEADFQFHLGIAHATGNRYFVDFMSYLGMALIPRARVNTPQLSKDRQADYLNRVHREHEDIYNGILRADPEAARAAMRTHPTNSRERLRRASEESQK